MPFYISVNPQYIRIEKPNISSDQRLIPDSKSPFNYVIDLPGQFQRVFSMEVAAYNIPIDTTPSFYPANPSKKILGKNKLDVSISNPDINAGAVSNFTITWPTRYFYYENEQKYAHSYMDQLVEFLNDFVNGDPSFAGNVEFFKWESPLRHTFIQIRTIGALLPVGSTTTVSFLFASGANSDGSIFFQMGFEKLDYVSIEDYLVLGTTDQFIESPFAVQLNTFAYIDIFVDEISSTPLYRAYTSANDYLTLSIDRAITRTTFQQSDPIRLLRRIHIRLELPLGENPADYDVVDQPHDITFHIFLLSTEEYVPAWLAQGFTA